MLLPIRLAVAMTRMMPHLHGRERIRSLRRICANQLKKDLVGKNLAEESLQPCKPKQPGFAKRGCLSIWPHDHCLKVQAKARANHIRSAAVFLKLVVAAIAKRSLCRCFTPAEKHLFGCFSGNFYRHNACIFVAAIAKRLFGTFATSTPEIGFAFFNFDWHW